VIKSRRMRWAGHVARMGEGRGVYRVLAGRPEGKRPPGRPRRRWEDNIKMDLRETGCEDGRWMELPQDCVQQQTDISGADGLMFCCHSVSLLNVYTMGTTDVHCKHTCGGLIVNHLNH